ncbi:hypothetical protein IWZ03DRAFT_374021 [Phyllosticta citriasiana]|uniref:Uncharacterized protein n=1 Tax=Phyllosticta citriasiana TaxID=595635 RepID=A0ABR1KP22_9PEZI
MKRTNTIRKKPTPAPTRTKTTQSTHGIPNMTPSTYLVEHYTPKALIGSRKAARMSLLRKIRRPLHDTSSIQAQGSSIHTSHCRSSQQMEVEVVRPQTNVTTKTMGYPPPETWLQANTGLVSRTKQSQGRKLELRHRIVARRLIHRRMRPRNFQPVALAVDQFFGLVRLQRLPTTLTNCKMTGLDKLLKRKYHRRCRRKRDPNHRSPKYRHRRQISEQMLKAEVRELRSNDSLLSRLSFHEWKGPPRFLRRRETLMMSSWHGLEEPCESEILSNCTPTCWKTKNIGNPSEQGASNRSRSQLKMRDTSTRRTAGSKARQLKTETL